MTAAIQELRRRLDAIVQSDHHPYDVQLAIEAIGIVEQLEGQLSAQTAEPARPATDAEIQAWSDRYDLDNVLGGQKRTAFEDAASLHMTFAGHPPVIHTEQPSLSDEREEDEYVIDRLSTILAGVSIAFKGEELPLHRHSYHDLAELAKAKMLEIDLLNHQIAELSAAQRQDSDTKDAERYRKAIAYEDNAGLLYCAVMNHCPDKAAIDAEFDAEAIDVGAIANGAPK